MTAVVYYSLEGNVRYMAETIAEALGADLVSLMPVKPYPDRGFKKFFFGGKAAVMKEKPELEPYRFDADDYDTVVLCSPVWAGTFTPPVRTFLFENDLKGKRIAAALCSGGGDAGKCFGRLLEAAGADAFASTLSIAAPSAGKEEQILRFAEGLKG